MALLLFPYLSSLGIEHVGVRIERGFLLLHPFVEFVTRPVELVETTSIFQSLAPVLRLHFEGGVLRVDALLTLFNVFPIEMRIFFASQTRHSSQTCESGKGNDEEEIWKVKYLAFLMSAGIDMESVPREGLKEVGKNPFIHKE